MRFKYLILILLPTLLFSGCSLKQKLKKADKKYEVGEYYNAASIYNKIYPKVKVKDRQMKAYSAFRLGECYSLINENEKAERALSNAVRYNYKDSIVYLYYAEALRKNKKEKDAITQYDIYLQSRPNDIRAINGKQSSLDAAEWKEHPTRYNVSKLTKFASKRTEFSPAFPGGDPDIVYFNSTRENKEIGGNASKITGVRNNDIYSARRNALGEWDNIEPVEGDINTDLDEGSVSFSADGKTMYFTRCYVEKGENRGAQICTVTRSGGKWGKVTEIKLSEDSSITFAHPTVSPDDKYLYFVSDLPGGFGGKDLWRSEKNGSQYGAPVNLGPSINTPGDEMFPYMREDGTLYFSSNGHPGFGGLDLFYATELENGEWEVTNMMYPINSNGDDFGISFITGMEKGMFSSNRGEKKGYDKLYEFELPPIEYLIDGKVTDLSGEPLGDATIRIVGDDGTNMKLHTKKDGSFKISLNKNVHYVMLGNCRGYLNQKEEAVTMDLEDSKTFPIHFNLASLSKPVGLDNIFFEFGKATLTPESSTALDKLVKILNDNPNITIEIGAHTDRVGSAEGNLQLSGKRAQSVVDYLIKKGIEAERLTAKGYGKTQPVTVDKNLQKKYSFLKVGDVLDEEYINSLISNEQKEIADSINRRTEFRVLKTTYKMY
ncbi:MAG: OmpA family protein [Paludibacteraceae bacterium]|nr:OmpA family protein [Paludibacteraceae bacterium]MBR5973384.1 OmpA family protein [Paludibacteraceae bacterium]